MVDIRYYVDAGGGAPFAEWFAELELVASARIARAIARMEQGNFSSAKGVGNGISMRQRRTGGYKLSKRGQR